MSLVMEDYVTVPRSKVQPAFVKEMATKEIKGASESHGQTSQTSSPSVSSVASSSNISSGTAASRSDVKIMVPRMTMKLPGHRKGKGSGADTIVRTTLGTWYEDSVPSADYLNFLRQFYVDLTAEWPSFSAAYEQYKVTAVKCTTWTGELTNRFNSATTATVANGVAFASVTSRVPYVTAQSMLQLADQPQLRLFDYGTTKNAFHEVLRPDGCYTYDAASHTPAIYMHQTGWMDCSSASKHCWGTWLQQTGGFLVVGSGIRIGRLITFHVEFRRRRYI